MVLRAGLEPAPDIEAFLLISMTYDNQEGFVCTMCVPFGLITHRSWPTENNDQTKFYCLMKVFESAELTLDG